MEIPPVVLAYIDPGTGSMIFQMLLAGLLSVGIVFRGVRERVFGFFRMFTGKKPSPPAEPHADAPAPPADTSADASKPSAR